MQNVVKIVFSRPSVFFAALVLTSLGLLTPAWGECTPMQVLELYQAGYTQAQVDEVCGNAPADQSHGFSRQQRPGYHCSTPYGWCPMQAPAPIGSACACYTVYGAIEGQVVE